MQRRLHARRQFHTLIEIGSHVIRSRVPVARPCHPLKETTGRFAPVSRLSPTRQPIGGGQVLHLAQRSAHRVPQQIKVSRMMNVTFDDERVDPRGQRVARRLSRDRKSLPHHNVVHFFKQVRRQQLDVVLQRADRVGRQVVRVVLQHLAQRAMLIHQFLQAVVIAIESLLDHGDHEDLPERHARSTVVVIAVRPRYGLNDPLEHPHGDRKIESNRAGADEESMKSRLVFPDRAFIFCGSSEADDETLNRLDLWRAYGANGNGIAITTEWRKDGLKADGLVIVPVEYGSDDYLKNVEKRIVAIEAEIDAELDKPNINENRVNELLEERMELEVKHKHEDYRSESEVRIAYYAGDQSIEVPPVLSVTADSGRLRTYVERMVKIGEDQALVGLYLTIGPRVSEIEASHWQLMADWTTRQLGLSGKTQTAQSKLNYLG